MNRDVSKFLEELSELSKKHGIVVENNNADSSDWSHGYLSLVDIETEKTISHMYWSLRKLYLEI